MLDKEIRAMQDRLLLWIMRVARYENANEKAGKPSNGQWAAVLKKIEKQRKVNKQYEASQENKKEKQ